MRNTFKITISTQNEDAQKGISIIDVLDAVTNKLREENIDARVQVKETFD